MLRCLGRLPLQWQQQGSADRWYKPFPHGSPGWFIIVLFPLNRWRSPGKAEMTTWTACWTSASGSCCPRWCWCEKQGEREPHSKRGDLAHKNDGSFNKKNDLANKNGGLIIKNVIFSQQKLCFDQKSWFFIWFNHQNTELTNKNCLLTIKNGNLLNTIGA